MRPALAIGRFANRVFERFVVDGLVTGTEETVRGAGGVVRAVQNGFVRSYALLLIAGFAGLALYFLLEQLMINSLLWTPLAFGIVGLFLPKRATGWWAALGAVVTLGIAIAMVAGFDSGNSGLQYTVDTTWISGLGVDYSLGIDGLNLFLIAADRGALGRRHRLRRLPRAGAPAALLLPDAARRDRDAGLLPRSGPAALRPLLRPDAGPVLLPLRRLGQRPRGRADAPRRRR